MGEGVGQKLEARDSRFEERAFSLAVTCKLEVESDFLTQRSQRAQRGIREKLGNNAEYAERGAQRKARV
jgi:hypothetical protein